MLEYVYSFLFLLFDFTILLATCIWGILVSCFRLVCPPEEKSVVGKNVLIVGAGRGIGRELALQFSELGANVVCWDIDSVRNTFTKQSAKSTSLGEIFTYTCDVTVREQVMEIADKVKNDVGNIDIMIHCCGIPSPRTLIDRDQHPIRKTINTSIVSHFWILEAFLPHMIENNTGNIVILSSMAGLNINKYHLALSTANLAVQGLAEALSEELRRIQKAYGVIVTLVHIYPLLVGIDLENDDRMKIPSFFDTMNPAQAASQVISAIRRDYTEISIPGHHLYFGTILKIFPRRAVLKLRDLFATGIDFG